MKKIIVILKKEYEKDALGLLILLTYAAFAVIYYLTK